jgi:ribosomal subunit interface protein
MHDYIWYVVFCGEPFGKGKGLMQKKMVYRGIEKTDVIEQHIEKHFKKIEDFLVKEKKPIRTILTLESNKPDDQRATIHVVTPEYEVYASITSDDLFSSITQVLDLAHEKILRENSKQNDKNNRGCDGWCRSRRFAEAYEADDDEEDEFL